MTYAIDFGTSNTVVTRWNAATQQPETLSISGLSWTGGSQNPPVIPSLLFVENAALAKVVAGQAVRDRGLDSGDNRRFFRNFKRGIAAQLKGFVPELDAQPVSFEQVGSWFLDEVIASLKVSEPGILESLIFTVPVDSFEAYRLWLGRWAQAAGIAQVQLLDEPTAAALGYGLADRELLLVLDFGGGTLDLSLVRLNSQVRRQPKATGFILQWGQKNFAESSGQSLKVAQVLAKAGQNLGGSDIDHWLADEFLQSQNLPINALSLRLVERIKISLSQQPQAQEILFDDESFESYELNLTRDRFNQILTRQGFFERLDQTMESVLQQAQQQGIQKSDINALLLVGGTSQIPAVQKWAEQYFDAAHIRSSHPFEAIAQGALQLGQGVEVKDFLYHSYGIRYWDRRLNSHNWHPIIKTGQPYPMAQPVEIKLGASIDNQPKLELVLGELGSPSAQTEIFFEGDRLITRTIAQDQTVVQTLNAEANTIAELDPPGQPGHDRLKVRFQINPQRFLVITVEDLLTRRILLADQPVVQLR